MTIPPVIFGYLARKFLFYLFLVSLTITAVLFIAGAFDVLQKFKSIYLAPKDFWLLISLKIPYLFNETSTITGFAATLLFLGQLASYNELIIIISSGMSIWRVFIAPVVLSFLFGVVIIALSPVSASGLKEYEKIETRLGNIPSSNLTISQAGVFLSEKYHDAHRLINIAYINPEKKIISDIIILVTGLQNQLIQRIDSPLATLEDGYFNLSNPVVSSDGESVRLTHLSLPTSLSIKNLLQRFMPPEMISFWELPKSVKKIENSGLPTLNYELHFFKQLFKPLAMSAMALMACWLLRLNRRGGSNIKNIILTLGIGLGAYFLLEIMLRVLAYGGLSPIFATLLPVLFIILISSFVVLHLQDA